jgi:mRNA interferase MazF
LKLDLKWRKAEPSPTKSVAKKASKQMTIRLIKRGEIYWVDLPNKKGRELKEIHPCLVISNDKQNMFSPLIIVLPITSLKIGDNIFPFQAAIKLQKPSVILVDQIQTIDREKFKERIGKLDLKLMEEVEKKIHLVLALKS